MPNKEPIKNTKLELKKKPALQLVKGCGAKAMLSKFYSDSMWLNNIMNMQESIRFLVNVIYDPHEENNIQDTLQIRDKTFSRTEINRMIMNECDKIVTNVMNLNEVLNEPR